MLKEPDTKAHDRGSVKSVPMGTVMMSIRLTTLKAALAELAHRTMMPNTFNTVDNSTRFGRISQM